MIAISPEFSAEHSPQVYARRRHLFCDHVGQRLPPASLLTVAFVVGSEQRCSCGTARRRK
jgi:hypothetical protein